MAWWITNSHPNTENDISYVHRHYEALKTRRWRIAAVDRRLQIYLLYLAFLTQYIGAVSSKRHIDSAVLFKEMIRTFLPVAVHIRLVARVNGFWWYHTNKYSITRTNKRTAKIATQRSRCDRWSCVRFQVFTAASIKTGAFWDIAPCSLVGVDRDFRGANCLQHQGDKWSVMMWFVKPCSFAGG
jgi:hypothetical protein